MHKATKLQNVILGTLILIGILALHRPVLAAVDAQLCGEAVNQQEATSHIPAQLLTAISYVESGKKDKQSKAFVAWPWTVNAQNKGYTFNSKKEAVAFVQGLQKKGIKSIDVGCMQVNLYHHAAAFKSLDEAFDPETNVAYAAKFLKGLFNETKNWMIAAGYYHSQTPYYSNQYRTKVLEQWKIARAKTDGESIQVANVNYPAKQAAPVKLAQVAPITNTKGMTIYEVDAARKAAVMAAWEERKKHQADNHARYVNAVKYRPYQVAGR